MSEAVVPPGKFMVDPYLDWTAKEGVPIYEDFGLDLLALPTKPWKRFGVDGAIVHVKGRGDAMTVFVLDLPPGGRSSTNTVMASPRPFTCTMAPSTPKRFHGLVGSAKRSRPKSS